MSVFFLCRQQTSCVRSAVGGDGALINEQCASVKLWSVNMPRCLSSHQSSNPQQNVWQNAKRAACSWTALQSLTREREDGVDM